MRRAVKLGLVMAAGLLAAMPLPRGVVEHTYARRIYPSIQPRLTAASNATPVALLDAGALVLAAAIASIWFVRLRHAKGKRLQGVAAAAFDTGAILAVVYLWFLAAWGLNYRREPLSASLDYRDERITPEALKDLARRAVGALNRLHPRAHAQGWPALQDTRPLLEPAFARAQQDLAMTWAATPGTPKRTLLNGYFTRVSIDGMTDPFFLETLANDTLLPFERAATIAHEWSHLAGYADESEASFVAWLVCMRGSESVQYSGWLSLFGTIMSALPRSDRDVIAGDLDAGPRGDLRAVAERIRRQTHPALSRAGYRVYDQFLRANRVESGIRSYSEVLRLLLGTRFGADGAPVLRRAGPSPP